MLATCAPYTQRRLSTLSTVPHGNLPYRRGSAQQPKGLVQEDMPSYWQLWIRWHSTMTDWGNNSYACACTSEQNHTLTWGINVIMDHFWWLVFGATSIDVIPWTFCDTKSAVKNSLFRFLEKVWVTCSFFTSLCSWVVHIVRASKLFHLQTYCSNFLYSNSYHLTNTSW